MLNKWDLLLLLFIPPLSSKNYIWLGTYESPQFSLFWKRHRASDFFLISWRGKNSMHNMKSCPCSYLHYLRVLYLTLPRSSSPVKISLRHFISFFLQYMKSIFIKRLPGTNYPLGTNSWGKRAWSLLLKKWHSGMGRV